jgi:hypothetical protein
MTLQPATPQDLQTFLSTEQIAAELISDLGPTPTVPAAALALGVDPEQIVKTLLFLVGHSSADAPTPLVVISHGERRAFLKSASIWPHRRWYSNYWAILPAAFPPLAIASGLPH